MKKKCSRCKKEWVPSLADDCYSVNGVDLCERCALSDLMTPKEPVLIEESHLENVCKLQQGALTCAFVGFHGEGFKCLKYSSFEDPIRDRIREGSMGAKGDNCSGPPDFRVFVG